MSTLPDPNEEVRQLFQKHVPEVAAGTVELVVVTREGGRVMVAVCSRDSNIHPVAACAGVRGIHLKSISRELSGEKVTVVLWSESAESFIRSALPLGPGAVRTPQVTLDPDAHRARVEVGRETLNYLAGDDARLRLVSKFVGWDIQLVCNG